MGDRDRSLVKKIVVVGCITQFIAWVAVMNAFGSDSGSISTSSPTPAATSATATAHKSSTPTSSPSPDVDPGTVLYALINDIKVSDKQHRFYDRSEFGQAWADVDRNGCDQRNDVLRRDMVKLHTRPGTNGCVLLRGVLKDDKFNYAARKVHFQRGDGEIEIDHVVSLRNAWDAGAYDWGADRREKFANDLMNLEAIDSESNQEKDDQPFDDWWPDDLDDECWFAARQITIKKRYSLTVTPAEREALQEALTSCEPMKRLKPSQFKAPKPKPIGEPKPKPNPEPEPRQTQEPKPDPNVYYKNCDAVRAAGAAPIHRGDPGYARHLDRDGDGVGCET
jgi:Excalibur calcium-binding domain/Protein of unknown function (DUF1524)